MAKINIKFNNLNFSIDESSFAAAQAELQQHLLTTMSGSGATINLGGISYSVSSTKLTSAKNDFIAHLGDIAGDGSKIVVDGVEYPVDSAKIQSAMADLGAALENLQNPDDVVDIIIVLDEAILDSHVLG
jgi:hypothetical protein